MPQSFSRILTHLVFSTKGRRRALDLEIQPDLYRYLSGILREIGCPPQQVGGERDHLHLLFCLSRRLSISQAVETIKTSSSKWIKKRGARYSRFHWQGGYAAFSVSESDREKVARYIRDQAEHHQKITFQQEYRRLLELYRIPYDERYMWD